MRPVRRGCRWLGLILWLPAATSIANRRVTGAVVYGHPQSKYHVNALECTAAMLDCDHTAPDSSGLKPRAAIAVHHWMPSRGRLARGPVFGIRADRPRSNCTCKGAFKKSYGSHLGSVTTQQWWSQTKSRITQWAPDVVRLQAPIPDAMALRSWIQHPPSRQSRLKIPGAYQHTSLRLGMTCSLMVHICGSLFRPIMFTSDL